MCLELVFKKPSADHWLRLQNAYDLWQSRQNKSDLHVLPYHNNYAEGLNKYAQADVKKHAA